MLLTHVKIQTCHSDLQDKNNESCSRFKDLTIPTFTSGKFPKKAKAIRSPMVQKVEVW